MNLRKSVLALEYVPIAVRGRDANGVLDLSADPVQIAFPASEAAPVSGDWKTASWSVDTTSSPPRYLARCLVGPGGAAELAKGTYDLWVKLTHGIETPVEQAREVDGTPSKLVIY